MKTYSNDLSGRSRARWRWRLLGSVSLLCALCALLLACADEGTDELDVEGDTSQAATPPPSAGDDFDPAGAYTLDKDVPNPMPGPAPYPPPGGSWNKSCRNGRYVSGGYCADCRTTSGSYRNGQCLYRSSCKTWCGYNSNGYLKCGRC